MLQLSTDFNPELDCTECKACRDFQSGEQIFIFYGARTNSELFVHNGFVYPDNEHDGLRLRLGVSRDDPLQAERMKLLGQLSIPASGDFMLKCGPEPVDGNLLAFLRVFNMGPGVYNSIILFIILFYKWYLFINHSVFFL